MKYVVWGWAEVFDAAGDVVDDRAALKELAGFIDDEDLYATDYLGGSPEENALAAALVRSGQLRFALDDSEPRLRVCNEYIATRALSPREVVVLREYTQGQWSDGMGECLFVPRGKFKDFQFQPLTRHEAETPNYPFVEVVGETLETHRLG